MKISDLKKSGHAPSLFSAFLHFDISFMVWVILGALMPFIMTDAALTGANLNVTPSAEITAPGQYTLIVKAAQTVKQNPKLTADQPKTIYNLVIKPGDPAAATRNAVKPVEAFVVNNSDPATIAAVNAKSKLIQIAVALTAQGNPNENVIALKPASALAKDNKMFQPVANGYPAGVKLTLIAIPLLAAGFWRLILGGLVDRFGSKRVGVVSLALTLIPLIAGWQFGTTYNALVFVGFFLGIAGASFAVALPMASRWYPPHLQGLAMGLAGAGNSGTVLATVFAPMLAKAFGWHNVFGLMAVPVLLVLVIFATLAKDSPTTVYNTSGNPFTPYAAVLGKADAWWFCLFYFVTFGGFVGLSSFFNTFFVDQYDAPKAAVGLWTWPFIIAGSFLRPVGGAMADRFGGVRMLTVLYGAVIVSALGIGLFITNFWLVCALLIILMGSLGMGNGSVFQLVPQRFKKEIGIMTGLVGAAGGVGGYYLNIALGSLKDATATYASGFFAFAFMALIAVVTLRAVAPAWTRSWLGAGGVATSHAPSITPEPVSIPVAVPALAGEVAKAA